MYHNIGFESGFNTLSVNDFQDHLEYLKNNYFVVSMDDYMQSLRKKNTNRMVTITFDDAYYNIYSIVFPFLIQYQFPATIFIPVSYVGKHNEWDYENEQTKINILSWDIINELNKEDLITFGSHGYTHTSLGICSQEQIKYEVAESKRVLEDKLKEKIKYFAYPYGQLTDMSAFSKKVLMAENFHAALSTIWRRSNKLSNQFQLNRIEILSTDTVLKLKYKMERIPDMKYYKQKVKNILFRLGIKN